LSALAAARRRLGLAGVVFAISAIWLFALEEWARRWARNGVHFQEWTSEYMMQTLPAKQLQDHPLQTLWYLHIQPPMFDIVRGTLVQLLPPERLVLNLDRGLQVVYVLCYAVLATRLFQWVRRLADVKLALGCWIVWLLHPAPMFVATLLDGTFLSTTLVFLFVYELWRLRRRDGSIAHVIALALALFFTRTVFQWYTFPIVAVLLAVQGAGRRRIVTFLAVSAVLVVPYLVKQRLMFGTISTTTFSGRHLAGLVWYRPGAEEIAMTKEALTYRYPQRAREFQGDKPHNSEEVAIENLVYGKLAGAYIKRNPDQVVKSLWRSFVQNNQSFWKPTARYSANQLTDRLPWADAFNRVFSGPRYGAILAAAALAWAVAWVGKARRLRRTSWREVIDQAGFELSVFTFALFIYLTCVMANIYSWVEADRLKLFLEPIFFVFCATQLYGLARRLCCRFTRR
jgi:hypothetical protein